jgi:methionyl aminopeptidase
MEQNEKNKWIKAGELGSLIMKKALQLAKPETPLLEIAEKLEQEAEKLNVKWAFPVNLSINEIAAHATPSFDDTRIAEGLLKIDLGISVDGFISDIAKSIDLTPEQKHKDMIKANEKALQEAIKVAKYGININEIGKKIHEIITTAKFSPIRNLSGHEMQKYNLHAGLNIPNYDNGNKAQLDEGIYAIEPFATTGEGIVIDGKPSGIFMLIERKPVRDMKSREILAFIEKNYETLPFSARWIVKKFGTASLIRLSSLAMNDTLHSFSELVEKSRMPVSQAEHTILVEKDKVTVLTQEN